MAQIEIIDPIFDSRWDKFIESHPYGWICHLSGWKKVLERSFKQMKGYYIALTDETGLRIQAGLPVFHVRSWITGNRLVAAPFATLFDPLVSDPIEAAQLLKAVRKLSADLKVNSIEIRSLYSGPLMSGEGLGNSCFYKHHFLDLAPGPDALMKRFHRTCVRQRISKALSSDLKLRLGQDEEDLKEFHRLFKLTRQRVGRPLQPYRFIKHLWDIFRKANQLELLLVEKDHQAIGGLLLFKFKKRVSAEFAASDESYKGISPNHFLFWEAIQRACEQGYRLFDFGRTAPTNHSLMDFKRRWGAEVVDLPQFYSPPRLADTTAHTNQSWRVRFAEGFFKTAPEFAQAVIGSAVYRHLG